MQTQTMIIVSFIWILASISYCSGDTCYCSCCAGNLCSPTLQDTIIIPSCGSSCESECQSKYPTQCTSGPGNASYQCTSGGGGGGSETPNWTGTFVVQNRCDKISCCCPANGIILSSATADTLRIQSQFTCPDATFSLNDIIPTPSGFSTTLLFAGDPIHVTISQDSRTIQLNNAVSPECSEVVVRNELQPTSTMEGQSISTIGGQSNSTIEGQSISTTGGQSISTIGGSSSATINLTFVPLLVGLIIIKLFINCTAFRMFFYLF
ncbi:unnamed protein product [Adineta steineri]|uniref:Uncharacterized protein n=1 Tax=Adineta steineri TaxID=433720 RepID=A0A814RPL6_9BILA|nr:unnamed protein product [Adineta steineri]CAF1284106.1 unnamed protein product [Adineta steineri]